jgi:hypothetical protein
MRVDMETGRGNSGEDNLTVGAFFAEAIVQREGKSNTQCGCVEKITHCDKRREAKSYEVRQSQWVDAKLARSLLAGVYEADFVREPRFKRNTALFRF